jgi:hypothetical protein
VWRMLFQMVEGRNLDSLLLELIDIMPWHALAATPEVDRRWFALPTTSSQTMSSPAVTTSTPSSQPPQTQTKTPNDLTRSPHADGEEPMDTRTDGERNLDADKVGEGVGDDRGQQSNDVEVTVPPTGSQPDTAVELSRTPLAKRASTTFQAQKNALKRQRRRRRLGTKDKKNHMPSSGLSGESTVGHLLAPGESYSMPIDVDTVDVLMRSFPITEEHQVCWI